MGDGRRIRSPTPRLPRSPAHPLPRSPAPLFPRPARQPKLAQRRLRQHAAQAGDTAATQEVHQDRLGLVVGVVAHGDGVCGCIGGHIGQEAITRLTGGFLQRQARLTRQPGHLRPTHSTWQSKAGSKLRHKIGVGV